MDCLNKMKELCGMNLALNEISVHHVTNHARTDYYPLNFS